MNSETGPPTVMQLATRLNIGGPARHILGLAADSGIEMSVVAGRPPAEEGELTDPRVEVTHVPLVRPLSPAMDARAYRAIRRLLVDRRPVVLHTHMAKAGALGRAAAASLRSRPRTVHTFHGHVLAGYFGRRTERGFLEAERRLARRTDLLIAVSEEIRDELLGFGIGRPEQWRVIPLGFDLCPFTTGHARPGTLRRALGLTAEEALVVAVGRLVPIKDHATLLTAVAELPDVHLAILGDGELRQELEQRAEDLRLGDRVHFTGWWGDVASAYADADVVALTSRNEGTPVSLIEAGAASRPTVATAVGGVPAVVADGLTGILVQPGATRQVTAALTRLLADELLRDEMGAAARRRVCSRFSGDVAVTAHESLYRELM